MHFYNNLTLERFRLKGQALSSLKPLITYVYQVSLSYSMYFGSYLFFLRTEKLTNGLTKEEITNRIKTNI